MTRKNPVKGDENEQSLDKRIV